VTAELIARPRDQEINPWLPLAHCSPALCVEPPRVAVGPARRGLRLAAALVVLLAGVPVAFAARWVGTARRSRFTAAWARLLLGAFGVRVESRGGFAFFAGSPVMRAAPDEGAGTLLVANHVSWLDPLVVAATVPSRLLAKKEVGEWPVIRTLAAGSGALFIDRERLSKLPEAVEAVAGALRAGDTVAAFPEGTTWCGRGMGEFRPALFQAAIDAGAAVRPAIIRYREGESTSTRACYVGEDSLLASILRVTATKGLVVEVTLFHSVRLTPTGTRPESRRALAKIAEAQVRTGVIEPHKLPAAA
jgi:1-acyl-sn-glycerol-3-phosphate acyltransferase